MKMTSAMPAPAQVCAHANDWAGMIKPRGPVDFYIPMGYDMNGAPQQVTRLLPRALRKSPCLPPPLFVYFSLSLPIYLSLSALSRQV